MPRNHYAANWDKFAKARLQRGRGTCLGITKAPPPGFSTRLGFKEAEARASESPENGGSHCQIPWQSFKEAEARASESQPGGSLEAPSTERFKEAEARASESHVGFRPPSPRAVLGFKEAEARASESQRCFERGNLAVKAGLQRGRGTCLGITERLY